eukprot:UN23775
MIYTTLMDVYADVGDIEKCLILFSEAKDHDIEPDSRMYSSLLWCCLKKVRLELIWGGKYSRRRRR